MTCPGMCGSGVRIGMTRTITKTALNIIPEVLEMESCGCFGVAPGSVVRASCVRRAASGPTPRPGASTSASACALLRGSYLLSSDFLFFEFYGRSKYKNESALGKKVQIVLKANQLATAVHLAELGAVTRKNRIRTASRS